MSSEGGQNCTKQSMDNLVSSYDSCKLGRKDAGDRKDVISKLADSVILHILSFLSTEEAIRTSTLARRWKSIWTYSSNFNFRLFLFSKDETQQEITRKSLFDLVDRLLQNAKYIRRFCFDTCGIPVDAEQTHSWISGLLKYKIEELYLTLDVRTSFVLANNLLAPESLNMLDLQLRFGFEVPSCISFPGLKTLKLSYVNFTDETSAQQLFSGCPVLQTLTLTSCNWKIKNVSIKIPTLTTLIIDDADDDYCLDALSLICNVMVDAENLVSLCCKNYFRVELVPINITSLLEASIDVSGGYMYVAQSIKLFSGICHIKSLKLSNKTLLILSCVENLVSLLPTFHNLTHIYVETGLYEHNIETLIVVLEKSPNLEVLDIAGGWDPDLGLEDWTWDRVPYCFKSSLKSFSISDFEESTADMKLLRFILKNAFILERIKICCLWPLSASEEEAKIRKQLQRMRRGLASCAIEFQES